MFRVKRLLSPKLANKLVAWFLIISLLPLLVAMYISYASFKGALEKEVVNNLSAIADGKAERIESYARERKADVTAFSHDPSIIDCMEKFSQAYAKGGIDSPASEALDAELRPFLTHYQELSGYDIFLITARGDIVFSVRRNEDLGSNLETGLYKDSELARAFDNAKTLMQTELSDFEFYPPSNQPAAFVAAPVLKEGITIGVVAIQMGNEALYGVVNDYTGLKETGEVVVATLKEDQVVFAAPLRHELHAAFRIKMPLRSDGPLPLQEAVQGKKGHGFSTDYRGREVIAAWQYLPSLRLGMVVKMDTEEAFASVTALRNLASGVGVVIALLVIAIALFLSRSISNPIMALHKGTEIIGAGNLDYKVATNATDEIGQLSRAFDRMTEKLKATTVSRDELAGEVAERTRTEEELRTSNERLQNVKKAMLNIAEDLEGARDRLEKQKDELEKARQDLERSNAELQLFAYVASHDLQEPLRKIRSFGERLEVKCGEALTEQGRDYLRRMVNAAERMSAFISDLLALSRVTTRAQPFNPVDLGKVTEEVLGDLETHIEQIHARVEVGELPRIGADATQMRQLLQNLIGNALKFHKTDGTPVVKIEGRTFRDDNHRQVCELTVEDNGIGFEQQYAERIFAIFQRLHSRTEYAGTGMGLAICKKIVERHGGSIAAKSAPDQGATFTVRLPVEHIEERGS